MFPWDKKAFQLHRNMTPDAITHLFKEAYDTFPPLEGKPTDDDLLAIKECLLPLLMVISYDQLNGIHRPPSTKLNMATPNLYVPSASPSTIKTTPTMPHQSSGFVQKRPINPASMTTPVTKRPNVALPNFFAMSLTRSGTMISKTLIDTFYTKVTAINIMALLDANSGGCMPST